MPLIIQMVQRQVATAKYTFEHENKHNEIELLYNLSSRPKTIQLVTRFSNVFDRV